jgi:DNA end-binding protein Ku
MPARAYWKGHLRLSLVSIAVELYAALDSGSQVTMHQIHQPSGRRVRYEKTVPGVGRIDSGDIVKGVATEEADTYVIIEPEELDALKIESKHTIDLVQFVDYDEVDPRYFDRPYYMVPTNEASLEGFEVIREALRTGRKLGLGQLAMRGKEYLVAVRPCGRGMLLETLHYANEVRNTTTVFTDIPEHEELDREKIELAQELIARKTAPFDAAAFEDHYTKAVRELVEVKRGERQVALTEEAPPRTAEVIDLMAALKKSVASSKGQAGEGGAGKKGGKGPAKKSPRARKKKTQG